MAPRSLARPQELDHARILVVEDDQACASLVRDLLAQERYEVTVAENGTQAESLLAQAHPDLVLLDIVLPDVDGLVLCARLRSHLELPIILLSGTRRRSDSILGLALGADDFIAKPFDPDELLARVEAVLRRALASRHARGEQRVGRLKIDRARLLAEVNGRPLRLTPSEFRLLTALASRPDGVLTREELAQALWDHGDVTQSRAVDVHVRRLRQKLASVAGRTLRVATIRGAGYRLISEGSGAAA